MTTHIHAGPFSHVMLTVSDPVRSRDFYTQILGFRVEDEFTNGFMLNNGSARLILFPAPNEPVPGDRFDENRIGLQNIGFALGSLQELNRAGEFLDEHRVPHGLIEDYGEEMGLYSLKLRDPDGIRVELLAPYGEERKG